jgi:hypothetical protein
MSFKGGGLRILSPIVALLPVSAWQFGFPILIPLRKGTAQHYRWTEVILSVPPGSDYTTACTGVLGLSRLHEAQCRLDPSGGRAAAVLVAAPSVVFTQQPRPRGRRLSPMSCARTDAPHSRPSTRKLSSRLDRALPDRRHSTYS